MAQHTFVARPTSGSSIQAFLDWEENGLQNLLLNSDAPPIWDCWESRAGLCVTRKDQHLKSFKTARERFKAEELEVAVRRSGGSCVAQGPGILNVTSVSRLSGPLSVRDSYLAFCDELRRRLYTLGFDTQIGPVTGSYCDGDYNLILDQKKVAGTAQRWIRASEGATIILSHAVINVAASEAETTDRVNLFYQRADGKARHKAGRATCLLFSRQNRLSQTKAELVELLGNALGQRSSPNPHAGFALADEPKHVC